MLRITILLTVSILLSGCFGSSSNNSSDGSDNKNPDLSSPNYSYYFGGTSDLEVYSYDHKSAVQELVLTAPTELAISEQIDEDGLSSLGALFMLKNGSWQFVTASSNSVKVISEASQITEICDSEPVSGEDITYLYYSISGADDDCSAKDDNLNYRIDTSMGADSSALALSAGLLFADEFEKVIVNNVGKGFIIKKEPTLGTVLFSNLDLTSSVSLEGNVTGYVRVTEFPNHDSIIIKFGEKLYDVTLAQLEAGNIGEAFYTNSNSNNLTTYAISNQFFYSANNKLYQYDLTKKESTLIYDLLSRYIGDLEISEKGVLIQIGVSDTDFLHISTDDLNAIRVTNLTLEASAGSSSMSSIEGGFIYNIKNVDEISIAYFISDAGIVTQMINAQWMNINSDTLDVRSLPVLLSFGDSSNTLSKWSVTTKLNELVYGTLPKDVVGMRADVNTKSDSVLFTTLSSDKTKKGMLYVFDKTKADSLKSISEVPGFTVPF
jgi:hypothetical protein